MFSFSFMRKTIPVFFVFSLFLFCGKVFAGTTDKYAPVYAEPLKASSLKDPLSYLLALPFEIIRWPMKKNLLFVEKQHLPEKTEWLYNYVKNHGIHPSLGYASGEGIQAGLKLDLPKLSGIQTRYPDFIFDAWVHYGGSIHFQTGTEIGFERIAGTNFSVSGLVEYEDRWEDDFYGIGPDTSRGEGVSYENETTTISGKIAYDFSHELKGLFRMTYENTNISEGEDNQKGQLSRFGLNRIPGIRGDKLLTWEVELKHDTRDFTDAPTQGGYRKINLAFTEGLDESNARYITYVADAAQYFKVGSPRRVIAVRGLMEHHDEVNGGNVPFYKMSKLGGYGVFPQNSRPLRSYAVNRFFDESLLLFSVEYRYAIWEYRALQLDAVPFLDVGQTFGEFSDFQFRDFKESYGVEFRLYVARNSLLNFSIAHGDEGTNFFVSSKKAF